MLGSVPSHLFGDGTLTYYLLPSGRNAIGYVDLLVLSCVFVLNKNTIEKKLVLQQWDGDESSALTKYTIDV